MSAGREVGMSDTSAQSALEQQYRRLLAFWYPWEHRRQYEGELIAVLMAGARLGQRWPSVRDTANLTGHGLRARFGAAGAGIAAPAWADAAAVVGLVGALVLLSQRMVRILDHLLLPGPAASPSLWLRAAAWAAVVVTVLAGWRLLAAACAWLTVAGESVLLALHYQDAPVAAVRTLLPFALAVVTVAALTVPAPRRRALAVLGWVRLTAFALAVAVAQGTLVYNEYARSRALFDSPEAWTSYVFYGLGARSQA